MTTALSIILAVALIAWIILSLLIAQKKQKQTKLLIIQLQKLNKKLEEREQKQAETQKAEIPTASRAFK